MKFVKFTIQLQIPDENHLPEIVLDAIETELTEIETRFLTVFNYDYDIEEYCLQ